MHTYLKTSEDKYDIGMWLMTPEGHLKFRRMFSLPNIKQAFAAVNMLNGGGRVAVEALHLEEEEE